MKALKNFVAFWLKHSELPIVGLAFVYLAIYAGQILYAPSNPIQSALGVAADVIYWIFAFDLLMGVISLCLTPKAERHLGKFFIKNSLSFAALLAPAFRTLRIFRLILLMRGLFGGAINRAEKAATMLLTAGPIVLFTSSLAILDCERYAPGANITNFSDAFWWAGITMTTVGYGDHYPVTSEGRIITGFLLVAGIAIISTATALVSRWVLGVDQQSQKR